MLLWVDIMSNAAAWWLSIKLGFVGVGVQGGVDDWEALVGGSS